MTDRREFLRKAALAGTGALLGIDSLEVLARAAGAATLPSFQADALPYSPASSAAAVTAPDSIHAVASTARIVSAATRVMLGNTGIESSFLAQGTGTRGWARTSEQVQLGPKQFERLLRHDLDQGVTFLDLADSYGSHRPAAAALRGVPRDRYIIQTKLWPKKEVWNTPSGGARIEIDRFRRELNTDVLDICLVHCMTDPGWDRSYPQVREDLSALKQAGVIRALGVSCHSREALKAAVSDPWVDLIFARINCGGGAGFWMDDSSEAIAQTLLRARKAGKAVVGMKIFGAGRLTDPLSREKSLRLVLDRGLVDAVSIGMCSAAQVDDVASRIESVALSRK